ncbi:MAG: hypothetical protein J1F31_04105 [Erysipelotrichales bacterium]|nr:hypothetical protein [Erysipelotrichales bacterium]
MIKVKEYIKDLIDKTIEYMFADFLKEVVPLDEIESKINLLLDKEKTYQFLDKFINIKKDIANDVYFTYDSDPASNSLEEIVMCYPGIYATTIYRLAHIFYELNEKVLARICSEYAHSKTGIDIHPGARISSPFFIDHGTGVVIGETSIVGKNVKMYQGVTLGAISLENVMEMRDIKRHPTIEDNVTIYAYAKVLGGDTIVGANSIIGSNALITKSVEKYSKIVSKCKH